MAAAGQELQVQEKRELQRKEEGTTPARVFLPSTDIYETDQGLTVVMEMPGKFVSPNRFMPTEAGVSGLAVEAKARSRMNPALCSQVRCAERIVTLSMVASCAPAASDCVNPGIEDAANGLDAGLS